MFKLLLTFLFCTPALASDIRLFSGEKNTAGLEIILKSGYKTYWRTPGDSGVPPIFNWQGSKNLKSIDIIFPTPEKFEDGIGYSIGYKKSPTFLLIATPENEIKPITLNLKLDYAVCETMCIPMAFEGKITLENNLKIEIKTPKIIQNAAKIMNINDKELTFSLIEHGDVLPEGANEKWSLPFPIRQNDIYKMKLEGIPSGETIKGTILKFTVLAEKGAYETELRLP